MRLRLVNLNLREPRWTMTPSSDSFHSPVKAISLWATEVFSRVQEHIPSSGGGGGEQRDRYRATYARQRNTPRNWKCPGWRAGSVLVSRLRSLGWNFMPKNRVNFLGWRCARLITNIRPDLFVRDGNFLSTRNLFSATLWKPWRFYKDCDYYIRKQANLFNVLFEEISSSFTNERYWIFRTKRILFTVGKKVSRDARGARGVLR